MTIGTSLVTFFCGKLVGKDDAGNSYYISKGKKPRRWVIYKNHVDPTTVPAEWHGWLHYRTDIAPVNKPKARYTWQSPHTPNQTGTPLAYFPAGHPLKGGKTPKATGDYEPWQP